MNRRNTRDDNAFVGRILGNWSSHPSKLALQRKVFFLLGLLPVGVGVFLAFLVVTNYRASDFAGVCNWPTFIAALLGLWAKISKASKILLCAGFATFGFSLTLNLLWAVSRTLSRVKGQAVRGRDELPFPAWVVFVFCFFWLVPPVLQIWKSALTAVDWRLYALAQIIANALCFLPFFALLCWTACAGQNRPCGEGEIKRHPFGHLFLALLLFVAGGGVLCVPEPAFFGQLVASQFGWISNCGLTAGRLFQYIRFVLSSLLFVLGAFHLLLWRLKYVYKMRKRTSAVSGEEGKTADDDGVPPCARYLLGHLPPEITLDGKIEKVHVKDFSPPMQGEDPYGLAFIMGGSVPTADQFDFFRRFVAAYDAACATFEEISDPSQPTMTADMILQGPDGSGRTEILLAAAMYAAIARGQRVLYMVPGRENAKVLAARINARLADLKVECYFSSDYLRVLEVDSWLDPQSGKAPPDILFATPEAVERAFFSNTSTLVPEKREALRGLLVGFGAVFVDDFLEMALPVRSHVAFQLDKLRLLQACARTVPQYVVATLPLYSPEGVDRLGTRLFGFGLFNRRQNVKSLRPRKLEDFWCGTLRVAGSFDDGEGVVRNGLTLDEASRKLVQITLASKDDPDADRPYRALLYRKGMSKPEQSKMDEDFSEDVKSGHLRVVSHLYELETVSEPQDNVFYLSLACGDASAALRLNLRDDCGSTAVFFRIAMEGEGDPAGRETFAIIPDETALPLRAHHLRSVLQFIPRLTPVESNVWARFGISLKHPCLRQAKPEVEVGTQVATQWHHDEWVEAERYPNGQIWPYLVLAARAAASTQGEKVDFNLLPDARESIWVDLTGNCMVSKRLILAKAADDGEASSRRQLVVWRDERGEQQGETDLAHSNELVCIRSWNGADGPDAEEFTSAGCLLPKGDDAKRYAMVMRAQYRHGADSDYLYPLKRLSWTIPAEDLEVPSVRSWDDIAEFVVERSDKSAYLVDGIIKGLVNMRSECMSVSPVCRYAYGAYLSCLVLIPTLDDVETVDEGMGAEELVRKCMDGTWSTDAKFGFSCALTHALTVAFRQRLSGWSFFATAAAFYTEGRQGSVGKATVWFVEPSNSGRSIYPVLERLMAENREFRAEIFSTAREVLDQCDTLEQLRMRSGLAFIDEGYTPEERSKAKGLLELLVSSSQRMADREKRRQENERRKTEREERKSERRQTSDYNDEEKEFDRLVISSVMNFDASIDVSKFACRYKWDMDKIQDLFMDVLWNHPEAFHVAKRGRYQWWSNPDGEVVRFLICDIVYGFPKEEYAERKAELDEAVGRAMKVADGLEGPILKAKALHDYIVRVCEYDMVARDMHDSSPLARTVYSVLVRRLAVCEGYTMAYRYLLDKAGIRSEEVISDKMNHCWNYVLIGGNWYHVDVTWDDPVYAGKNPATAPVLHDYFLLSDSAIRAKKHCSWDVRGLPPATDTRYDGQDWNAPDLRHIVRKRDAEERGGGGGGKGVSWESRRHHPLFRAKDRGNVRQCRGKIHLRVFFVDDGDSAWNEETRKTYREVVADVARRLEREGPSGVKVSWTAENRAMAHSVSAGNDHDDWVPGVLGLADEAAVAEEQNRFRQSRGFDEAPIVFVFNKDFRSAASQSTSSGPSPQGEWAIVAIEDDFPENPEDARHTLLHELLHLFGAEDFYYPPAVKKAAEKWLPGSVMNGGNAIDDMTRILIGWDSDLSGNAEGFLDDTKSVTEKEIDEACAAEWKKKWH